MHGNCNSLSALPCLETQAPCTPLDKMKPTISTPSPQSLASKSTTPTTTPKQPPLSAKAEKFAVDEESELYRKAWNAAEAKVRRICTPKEVSGKVDADEKTLSQWNDLTVGRNQLIKMMMDVEGNKACYHSCLMLHGVPSLLQGVCVHAACKADWFKKVEKFRREEEFRKVATRGGWYSELDMRKPVSEGGLGKNAFFSCSGRLKHASC